MFLTLINLRSAVCSQDFVISQVSKKQLDVHFFLFLPFPLAPKMLYILLLSDMTSKSWKSCVLEKTQIDCELVWDFQVWMGLEQFVQKLPSTHLYWCCPVPWEQAIRLILSQLWKVWLQRDLVQNPFPELELCSRTGTALWVCVTKLCLGSHARRNVCSAKPEPCKPGQGRRDVL